MNSSRTLAALLVLVGCGSMAHAQVLVGPYVPGGIAVGGKIKAGRVNLGFSAQVPGYGFAGYVPFFPYGYGSRTTIVQLYSPPPPPTVVIAPLLPRFDYDEHPRIARGQRVPLVEAPPREEPEDRPLPGAPAGQFRPIRPEDRARALQPVPPQPPPPQRPADRPAPPEKEKPKAEAPPKPPGQLPPPPQPEADPRAENARQLALGKDAFANQEYGRALNRFRQAIAALPDEPQAYFLVAQTFFVMGKYAEAVEAIHAGMRRRPDWPLARFQPLELYEPNVALYPEQLRRLEDVLTQHPNDPVLLFLNAYQLWFDGRKDEARALLQRAAPLVKDRTFIDRFLDALPGQRII